jgi:hypothetical protein
MTLYPFLIGYYVILGIFGIFNLIALRYINRFRYLGPSAVKYVLGVYLIVMISILVISQIFIFQFDWEEELFSF